MIKLMIAARTTPQRSRAEALAHLKRVHGPMVYDPPADAGAMPSRYVQNHVVADFALPDSLAPWRGAFDLVTEIWFEDLAHLGRAVGTPYYKERLQPDESNFVDQTSVRPLVVTETGPAPAAMDAACKLFIYLAAAGSGFKDAWPSARGLAQPHCLAQLANIPVSAPGAPPAFADGVWSLWFADRAAAQDFAARRLPDAIAALSPNIDASRCFMVMADEYPVHRLRRENAP